MTASAIYKGGVAHRRFKPRPHFLRYSCFWLLLDLDELPDLSRTLRLFSHNRWNVFSVRDQDYGGQTGEALRPYVEAQLAAAGLTLPGGRIRLLTMPRLLGYAFNPLSVFFCYDSADRLAATLYEVRNTFGERHSYVIAVDATGTIPITQRCRKEFHVSPFMDMALDYQFRVTPPGQDLALAIAASDSTGKVLDAWLTAQRCPLSDRALATVFFAYPLLTLKVIAAIHYEAVRLVLKGLRVRPHPAPPAASLTIVSTPPQKESAA